MFQNKTILCTICARGGSKGVKNKNIRTLLGKPLIAYTIEQAYASGVCEYVVVSTDDDQIAEVARHYKAEVFFKRPAYLAVDTAPKIPVIQHALIESEQWAGKKFDIVLDLDPTSPLRASEDIVHAFNIFFSNGYDNLITASPSRKSPYFNMVELSADKKVRLCKKVDVPCVRRQDAPCCFDMNASIYIWKRDILLTHKSVFLDNTGLYVMPAERSVDIDTELDFVWVEFLMGTRAQTGGNTITMENA